MIVVGHDFFSPSLNASWLEIMCNSHLLHTSEKKLSERARLNFIYEKNN